MKCWNGRKSGKEENILESKHTVSIEGEILKNTGVFKYSSIWNEINEWVNPTTVCHTKSRRGQKRFQNIENEDIVSIKDANLNEEEKDKDNEKENEELECVIRIQKKRKEMKE
jgi:hypothetical protein